MARLATRLAQQRLRTRAAAVLLTSITQAAIVYSSSHYNKTSYHSSKLSGEEWVEELRNGHPDRIKTELGVSQDVFETLILVLEDIGFHRSRYVSLAEQVAIFLYTCTSALSVRRVGERFQRSNSTITR